MSYQQGRFTSNFNLQFITIGCNTTIFWFPDGSDALRDSISNSYATFLGRYGEYEGVENWVYYWNNGGAEIYNYSVSNMIQAGAISSGELGSVNTYGRHTGMSLGNCDIPGLSLVVYKQDGSNAGYGNIPLGQYVVFSWYTTNSPIISTNIYLKSGPPGASAPGSVAASGSSIYYPPVAGTYIYYIAATNIGGFNSSFNYPFGFIVQDPPPAISYLIVYKQDGSNAGYGNIPLGQYVRFTWQVTGTVTSASLNLLSGPSGASALGSVAASGSSIYYPPVVGTYIYYITATGPGGTASSYNIPFQFVVYNPVVYGCTDPAASNYNPNANTDNGSCVYPAPTASLDISPTYICPSGSSTLYWSTSNTTSVYITGIGYVGSSGSISVSPFSSTTYTLTASGRGGSTQKNQTVTVYQYADVTMSANRTTIVRGESVTLTWSTSGSASSAYFSPGLGSTNLSGSYPVTPNTTTTYTIAVTGTCNNDSAQVTITVLQPPTIDMVAPPSLNYNQQSTVSYSVTNIPNTLTMIPSYEYTNGSIVYGATVNLPTSDNYSGTFPTNIPYNIYGPRIVNYLLNGIGYGNLADAETRSININIDETPDNVIIPDNVGIINQLVVSPDKDITSYKVLVNDIDIPVEIKSNRPIQVDINDQDNWTGVRQI